ncbi:MAG: zinc ribbon domain-containing protein [Aminipila sp.]
MENKNLKKCDSCGADMSKTAKACPQCGANNKKPIYKRAWFIVLMVVIVIGAIASLGGNDNSNTTDSPAVNTASDSAATEDAVAEEPAVEYTACTVGELVNLLDENALKAEKTWVDQYVELTGKLGTIDSDGSYISLRPSDDPYAFTSVQCYIKTDEQLDQVMNMTAGDTVVLRGQITDIGEVLGYSLDIDSIVQ